jgi:hypothetical protein
VNCRINPQKATQAAARLIQASGGSTEYLRLIKLAYLADRESIIKRGVPIFGGTYFVMRKGPAISELMDFAKARNAPDWKGLISPRFGHLMKLESTPSFDLLSETEVEILDSTVVAHSNQTTDELVHWCHDNCPEVEKIIFGRREISIEKILSSGHVPEEQAAEVVSELRSMEKLGALLN